MVIDELKRVRLTVAAAGTDQPVSFAFIYGVAGEGLCLFENRLSGKREGERLHLEIPGRDGAEFFGHLLHPLLQALKLTSLPDPISLTITVEGIEIPDSRAVVQAMASSVGHGGCGGGDCGCGCS